MHPCSGTRLEANTEALEEAQWWHQVVYWEAITSQVALGRIRGKKSRLRGGQPPEAHLAAYLCATQCLMDSWPAWGGWPPEGRWCYVCRVHKSMITSQYMQVHYADVTAV